MPNFGTAYFGSESFKGTRTTSFETRFFVDGVTYCCTYEAFPARDQIILRFVVLGYGKLVDDHRRLRNMITNDKQHIMCKKHYDWGGNEQEER